MARRLVSMIAAASMLAFLLPFAASAESSSAQGADCQEFDTTGFSICGEFLQFWNANGGIPVFGYPLSDAHQETNPDTGQPLLVQYFERQRFELHPENQGTVFAVLFGRLGAQILKDVGVGKMRVLASPLKLPSMTGYDLEVTAYQSMADIPDATTAATH